MTKSNKKEIIYSGKEEFKKLWKVKQIMKNLSET